MRTTVVVAAATASLGCNGARRSSKDSDRARLVARATTSATTGVAPLQVRLADASNGAPTAWRWDFGDGTGSSDRAPVHVYTHPGRFTVQLEVTDVLGNTHAGAVATVLVADPQAAALAGAAPAATPGGATGAGSPFWYQGDTFGNPLKQHTAEEGALAGAVAAGLNAERARAGLPPLSLDDQAQRAAKAHADDMHGRRYFSHLSPEGWTPEDRLRLTGGAPARESAENIFSGPPDAAAVVATWMASPGHRANVLSPALTHVGVGARLAGGASLVVALFTAR